MLNYIVDLFKSYTISIPNINSQGSMDTKRAIVSSLSRGNVLLQQKKYMTKKEILQKKSSLCQYFLGSY